MARAKSSEQAKSRTKATALDDINRGIDRLKDLMAQVEDLSREGHPYREAVLARTDLSIRESIRRIFGEKSTEYQTHKIHKLRTNSRVESAQTTAVLKQLVAQLEGQKRELLGLNPPPQQPDPSPSSEKAALKTVRTSQNVAQITIAPIASFTPPTAPVTLSVAMTTNLATPDVPASRLSLPADDSGQQSSSVPEALASPATTPTQSPGEFVSSPCTPKGGTFLDTKTGIQPDSLASPSSSLSITTLHSPASSSTHDLNPVSHTIPLPSPPATRPDNSTNTPDSSSRNTSNIPQQIAPPPMNITIVQPLEPQMPHITPGTDNLIDAAARQSRSTSSPISAAGLVNNSSQDEATALAPVHIIKPPSADDSATSSGDCPPARSVLSSRPLSPAADVPPSIVSGSSGSDFPIRSDDPTNPIQDIELRRDDSLQSVRRICSRFHLVTRQLRMRRDDRPSLEVEDEYDVQDLMHALLRVEFDEVKLEEWRPRYAQGKAQTSYLLHREKAVIVVKKTKAGVTVRDLSEQVKVDTASYSSRADCQTLFCFIYDPEGRIGNPRGLEAELTMVSDKYTVEVIIAPK